LQTKHSLYREPGDPLSGAHIEKPSQQGETRAKRNWGGPHPIDIRLTIPLLFGRVYFTVVAGYERRSAERLQTERRLHPLLKMGNILMFLVFGTVVGLALLSIVQLISYWVLL
jgi:hypothetical protein